VLGWKKLRLDESLGTRIVTYADDLVILCTRGNAEEALTRLRELMGKLKLAVNEEKTRICSVPEGSFDFLGYTFGAALQADDRQSLPGHAAVEEEHPAHDRNRSCADRRSGGVARDHGVGANVEPHVARVGELLPSWHDHPSVSGDRPLHDDAVGPVAAQQAQESTPLDRGYPPSYLYETLGLVRLTHLGHGPSWTKA